MIGLTKPDIGDEEVDAAVRVLRSGMLAQGPEVAAFEEEFSALVDGRSCVAVNSGTAALHLGMAAAGIGPGDEVIVPSFSFAASANAIRLCGAEPVFVDIDLASFCIDPAAATAAVTSRTAAIMAVHLYGHPAAMWALREIAETHSLLLVEDAAQAHAASLDGTPVGALGHLAAFSFYPTKNMTTGEGGIVVTADPEIARRTRLLRNQGMEERYRNEIVGHNARLTDLGAAIGRVQLRRLGDWTSRRQEIAGRYDAGLQSVTTPPVAEGARHVYHQYTVRSNDRDQLARQLSDQGVASAIYYPVPIHRLPAYSMELDLPETELAVREVLSIPIHPGLSDDDVDTVIEAVNA